MEAMGGLLCLRFQSRLAVKFFPQCNAYRNVPLMMDSSLSFCAFQAWASGVSDRMKLMRSTALCRIS